MPLGNETEYYARRVWVSLKRSLGLSVKSDRKFFCEEIVRGMMTGSISKNMVFTNDRMPAEGIGSQILSRLSVGATARALGYGFAYTPLYKLGHPEGEKISWSERIDETFNLGSGELNADACELRHFRYPEFCNDKKLWQDACIVSVRDFYAYTDENPDILAAYARQKIHLPKKTFEGGFDIALHARRGDVSRKQNKNRYIPNARLSRMIEAISLVMGSLGSDYRISVYTNGSLEEMSDLIRDKVRIVNTLGAVETFEALATSDILVSTNSSFSYLSSILNDGIVLYDRHTHKPLAGWISIGKDGSFDEKHLKHLIETNARH